LLGTPSIPAAYSIYYRSPFDFKDLKDKWFNIRDKHKGLNLDFISYANLVQTNMDPLALLDSETLLNHTQRTFETFFQHYASQTNWTDGTIMAYERVGDEFAEKVQVVVTEPRSCQQSSLLDRIA
jgi:hypothetical protein